LNEIDSGFKRPHNFEKVKNLSGYEVFLNTNITGKQVIDRKLMSKALKRLYHDMTKVHRQTQKEHRPFHEAALKGLDRNYKARVYRNQCDASVYLRCMENLLCQSSKAQVAHFNSKEVNLKSYQPKSPEPEPDYAEEPKAVGFLDKPEVKIFDSDLEQERQRNLSNRLEESEEYVKDISREVQSINKIHDYPTANKVPASPVYDSNYESTQDISKEVSDGSDIIIESPKQSWPTKLKQKINLSKPKNSYVSDHLLPKQKPSPPDAFMPKTPTRDSSGSSPEMTFTVTNGENALFESRLSKKRDIPASYQERSTFDRKSRSRFGGDKRSSSPSLKTTQLKSPPRNTRKSRSRYDCTKMKSSPPQRTKSPAKSRRSLSPRNRKSKSRFDNRRSKKRDHSPSPDYSVKKKRSPSPRSKSSARRSRARDYNSEGSKNSERKSRRRDYPSTSRSKGRDYKKSPSPPRNSVAYIPKRLSRKRFDSHEKLWNLVDRDDKIMVDREVNQRLYDEAEKNRTGTKDLTKTANGVNNDLQYKRYSAYGPAYIKDKEYNDRKSKARKSRPRDFAVPKVGEKTPVTLQSPDVMKSPKSPDYFFKDCFSPLQKPVSPDYDTDLPAQSKYKNPRSPRTPEISPLIDKPSSPRTPEF